MVTPRVGFIVYGVHKDGLQDPMGAPFIDDALVARSSDALKAAGLELVEHDIVVASKQEARECFAKFRRWTTWTPCVRFSGTWVWAAHMAAAIRDSPARERPSSCGRIRDRRGGVRWAGW